MSFMCGSVYQFEAHAYVDAPFFCKIGGSMFCDSLLTPFHFPCDFYSQGKVEFKDVSSIVEPYRGAFALNFPSSSLTPRS